jgi:hypothetical protein
MSFDKDLYLVRGLSHIESMGVSAEADVHGRRVYLAATCRLPAEDQ